MKRQWIQWVLLMLGLGALLAFPAVFDSPYALHMMILLFLSVIMGASWNVLGGFTGQYSVGHAAYFGVGAYSTLILLQSKQLPPWLGCWVGVVMAMLVALVIGSVCFRLRGPYFVLASIAVTEIMRLTAINWKSLTNGAEGILATDIPTLHLGSLTISAISKVPFYYAGLTLAIVTVLATVLVRHSKLGYFLQAIREDQDAANSLGINLFIYKNAALLVSAIFTSLAGSFSAVYVGFIDPGTVLSLDLSVQIVLICIIGGIGTIWGPVIGALVLVPLSEMLRGNYFTQALIQLGVVGEQSATGLFLKEHLGHAHLLIYGILVVVVILFMPDGVLGYFRQLLQRKAAKEV